MIVTLLTGTLNHQTHQRIHGINSNFEKHECLFNSSILTKNGSWMASEGFIGLSRNNTLETTNTDKKSLSVKREQMSVLKQLARGHDDLWSVVPRQIFAPYCHILISSELVVLGYVGCLRITSVRYK